MKYSGFRRDVKRHVLNFRATSGHNVLYMCSDVSNEMSRFRLPSSGRRRLLVKVPKVKNSTWIVFARPRPLQRFSFPGFQWGKNVALHTFHIHQKVGWVAIRKVPLRREQNKQQKQYLMPKSLRELLHFWETLYASLKFENKTRQLWFPLGILRFDESFQTKEEATLVTPNGSCKIKMI